MAHSIELRVPFLDKEVMAVASRLSLNQKINKNNTKVLLREAFDGVIPSTWLKKRNLVFQLRSVSG